MIKKYDWVEIASCLAVGIMLAAFLYGGLWMAAALNTTL